MTTPTSIQIIQQDGKPAFAVIPYQQYLELVSSKDEDVYLPHEVVGLQIKKGLSLIAAWRIHLGFSQKQLAEKLGVKQPAIAQFEKEGANLQRDTLQKLADALNVSVEQLEE